MARVVIRIFTETTVVTLLILFLQFKISRQGSGSLIRIGGIILEWKEKHQGTYKMALGEIATYRTMMVGFRRRFNTQGSWAWAINFKMN